MLKMRGMFLVVTVCLLTVACATFTRPQEPKPPLPYLEGEVTFENGSDHTLLHGTLAMPNGGSERYPAVILVSGSGPTNRNEEYLGHKPFFVISDYLVRNGIAVLRYDKRQYQLPVRQFYQNTTEVFAADAAAAISYLRSNGRIDPSRIGLIGHSEGGYVIAMLASMKVQMAFAVLLGAPGLPFGDVMMASSLAEYTRDGVPKAFVDRNMQYFSNCFSLIKTTANVQELQKKVRAEYDRMYLDTDLYDKKDIDYMIEKFSLPWFRYLIGYQPEKDYQSIRCPVLALNGGLDCQVTAKENLAALGSAFQKGGNTDCTLIEMPGLNHMFQDARTGRQSEYGEIEETFSPAALRTILKWISQKAG